MKTQRYIITARTDAYHASRMVITGKGLSYVGAVKTKWVHDDNYSHGFTLTEARKELHSYYIEDKEHCPENLEPHKFFSNYYRSDIMTYAIEPIENAKL